jgi:hypothetical protein
LRHQSSSLQQHEAGAQTQCTEHNQRRDPGIWAFFLPLLSALILTAVLGFWHDRRHRLRREFLFILNNIDRAKTMMDYYTHVHGSEA